MQVILQNNSVTLTARIVFVILLVFEHGIIAKSNPIASPKRLLAVKPAKSFENGISILWLGQTWAKDILNDGVVINTDLELLKTLGFKSIGLPVAFKYFESAGELNGNNYLTETAAGDQVSTTGVTFPYSAETFPTINSKAKGTWAKQIFTSTVQSVMNSH